MCNLIWHALLSSSEISFPFFKICSFRTLTRSCNKQCFVCMLLPQPDNYYNGKLPHYTSHCVYSLCPMAVICWSHSLSMFSLSLLCSMPTLTNKHFVHFHLGNIHLVQCPLHPIATSSNGHFILQPLRPMATLSYSHFVHSHQSETDKSHIKQASFS